jgi:hypothetical protein
MAKKLYFHWEGKERLAKSEQDAIRTKTKRRARRHFRGEPVRHRVISKSETTITFAFKRRSMHPITIRWRRELA